MRLNTNLKNVISLFSIEFVSRLIGFFAVTYLARILGTDGFGIINIGLAVLSYLMVLATSGLNLFGTKKIISGQEDSAVLSGNIIFTRFTLSVIVLIVFTLLLPLFVQPGEQFNVILMYSLFLLPSALLLEWFFHGFQKMDIIAFGRAVGMAAYLFAIIILVKNPHDTVLTGVAWLIGGIINAAYLFIIFRKMNYTIKLQFKVSVFLKYIKESFSLSAASIIAQFVIQFPVIYLGITLSSSASGVYSAAYKIIVLILVIDRVFNALFFPKIVQYINSKVENTEEMFNRIIKIVSAIGISVLLISSILSDIIVVTIFGSEFKDAVFVFTILLWSFYLTLLNSVFTYTLIALNLENIYVKALSIAAIFFFAAIVLLTYFLGVAGAAISYVVFELTAFVCMAILLNKYFDVKVFRSTILPALMIFLISIGLGAYLSLPFQIGFALCAGLPLILLMIGIGKEEFNFVKRIFI